MIVIVSHSGDDHATRVMANLDRSGQEFVLVDTACFPAATRLRLAFDGDDTRLDLDTDRGTIDLRSCRAIWWRRPQPFELDPNISSEAATFTYTECHEAFAGMWAALTAHWVNRPELDEKAHHKPYQLACAQRLGIPIPRTLITNDPAQAIRFIESLGPEGTIYKTFLATEQHWRETRRLRTEELALIERVRLAPVIFQEYVPAVADIRATVIGRDVFAAAIRPAPGGYEIDYRMDMDGASFEPTELPSDTVDGIRALMETLGLAYGAIDLRRRHDGSHVFLEINPAGEWLFVEDRTDLPITQALANLLTCLDNT